MKCRRKGIQRCFFGLSDFLALQSRVGSTLPVEFLELQAWWAAGSPRIPTTVLTGPMSRLIHWGALIKAGVVGGPLSLLSPAHRPVKQLWALGFWTGLHYPDTVGICCGGEGFDNRCVLVRLSQKLCGSNYPLSIAFIVVNEFCERFSYYGMRGMWPVSGEWLSHPEVFTQTGLVFLSCAMCSISCLSKLIDILERVYEQYPNIVAISKMRSWD